MSVLLADDGGAFLSQRRDAALEEPTAVALTDADGSPDLVVLNPFEAGPSVLADLGDGSFRGRARLLVGDGREPVAADLNEDGKPDVLVADPVDHDIYALPGNGDAASQPQRRRKRMRVPCVSVCYSDTGGGYSA